MPYIRLHVGKRFRLKRLSRYSCLTHACTRAREDTSQTAGTPIYDGLCRQGKAMLLPVGFALDFLPGDLFDEELPPTRQVSMGIRKDGQAFCVRKPCACYPHSCYSMYRLSSAYGHRAYLGHLVASWSHLGPILTLLGPILRSSWGQVVPSWGHLDPN